MTDTKQNRTAVTGEIKRLRAVAPMGDDQVREVAKVALRFQSLEAVRTAVDSWMYDESQVPTPRQFGGMAPISPQIGVGCEVCGYTGFAVRTDRRQTIDGMRDIGVAYYCSCHPGRAA